MSAARRCVAPVGPDDEGRLCGAPATEQRTVAGVVCALCARHARAVPRMRGETSWWILGGPDPEMTAIETLLREAGQQAVYATAGGRRAHPGNAYAADPVVLPVLVTRVVLVECAAALEGGAVSLVPCDYHQGTEGEALCGDCRGSGIAVVRVDHHRPGDAGFGRPPAEFLAASSIGQVMALLAGEGLCPAEWPYAGPLGLPSEIAGDRIRQAPDGAWAVADRDRAWLRLPDELVLCAAADHCLGAAYRGECPGVDPDALMRWRAASRAAFQKRPVEAVLADVERAQSALSAASPIALATGIEIRDMRGPVVPELPEAAARLGVGYVAGPIRDRDGRDKITCSGSPEQVAAFLAWAHAQGFVGLYGDPARGFAGGYTSPGNPPK